MVREFDVIAGRRGGKSRALSVLVCWLAALCDWSSVLAPGETAIALVISRDQRAAKIILGYLNAMFDHSALLSQAVESRNAESITLTNGINVEVRPANVVAVRGPSYVCVLGDEASFWYSEVNSANPDSEIIAAARPGLMTTRGPLLMASSAYARKGVMHDQWKRYYGANGPPDILVAYGSSRDFNPSLDAAEIERELAKDPVRNRAEYLSEFRNDVEGFLPRSVVEACVADYHELPPVAGIGYRCFVDAASGVPGGDSFTMAVSHRLGDHVVIDAIREARPPFSPSDVVNTVLVPLCKAYGISKVVGDNYAGQYPKELIRSAGISYELADKHRSELYQDPFLPLLNSRKIDLPRNERAINQICSLERSTQRSGRDLISHPTHGHDDIANAIAGAAYLAHDVMTFDGSWAWVNGNDVNVEETDEQRHARLRRESDDWARARMQGYLRSFGAFGWP